MAQITALSFNLSSKENVYVLFLFIIFTFIFIYLFVNLNIKQSFDGMRFAKCWYLVHAVHVVIITFIYSKPTTPRKSLHWTLAETLPASSNVTEQSNINCQCRKIIIICHLVVITKILIYHSWRTFLPRTQWSKCFPRFDKFPKFRSKFAWRQPRHDHVSALFDNKEDMASQMR